MALAMTAGIAPVPAQELRFDWERTVQRLEAIEGRAVPSSYATPSAVAAGGGGPANLCRNRDGLIDDPVPRAVVTRLGHRAVSHLVRLAIIQDL